MTRVERDGAGREEGNVVQSVTDRLSYSVRVGNVMHASHRSLLDAIYLSINQSIYLS